MKQWIRKISISLALAVAEMALGILLLINPMGLASMVMIALGILLVLLGCLHTYEYIRLPREEALKTWKLSSGAGLLVLGIASLVNWQWMVQLIGTLTTLYGAILLVSAFMKLQMAIDALRGRRRWWYLMAISFACSAILATLLFAKVLTGMNVWTWVGILLIAVAVLDAAYFVLGRKEGRGKNVNPGGRNE